MENPETRMGAHSSCRVLYKRFRSCTCPNISLARVQAIYCSWHESAHSRTALVRRRDFTQPDRYTLSPLCISDEIHIGRKCGQVTYLRKSSGVALTEMSRRGLPIPKRAPVSLESDMLGELEMLDARAIVDALPRGKEKARFMNTCV